MTALYRVYGEDGRLLYVGITADWRERMKQHARTALWFPSATHLMIQTFPSRALAEVAEREAIKAEWPLWNRAGSPGQAHADDLLAQAGAERRSLPSGEFFARCHANDDRLWHLIDHHQKIPPPPSRQGGDRADTAA